MGACPSGTVWAGLCLIHHHHRTERGFVRAQRGGRVPQGGSFLAPGSLARRRLARVIHHNHHPGLPAPPPWQWGGDTRAPPRPLLCCHSDGPSRSGSLLLRLCFSRRHPKAFLSTRLHVGCFPRSQEAVGPEKRGPNTHTRTPLCGGGPRCDWSRRRRAGEKDDRATTRRARFRTTSSKSDHTPRPRLELSDEVFEIRPHAPPAARAFG